MRLAARIAITLALIALVTNPVAAQRSAQPRAKDLFYDPSGATPDPTAAQPAPQYMGVSYWVELLEPSGQFRRVTTDHPFRAGDRIRLNVLSNLDGYLTVLNIGSTNRVTTLFPLGPEVGGAPIRAGQLYQVPPTAYLRFDNNPGEETLLLLFSPTPMGEAARLVREAPAKGAKDLVVEADPASRQPASYAVAPVASLQQGGIIALPIKLKHD